MGDYPLHGPAPGGVPTKGILTDHWEAAQRLLDEIWEYPPLETAIHEGGVEEMEA